VLEHLYLTYRNDQRFRASHHNGQAARHENVHGASRADLHGGGLGYLPAGRKSPAVAEPRGLPTEQVRNEIGAKLVAMDALLAQCESRFGRRVKLLDHPILGPLTAPQWRTLHLVHGRHHQKQLLRLREMAPQPPP
jgi:hypothetical protein